jgi:hypothetical protein
MSNRFRDLGPIDRVEDVRKEAKESIDTENPQGIKNITNIDVIRAKGFIQSFINGIGGADGDEEVSKDQEEEIDEEDFVKDKVFPIREDFAENDEDGECTMNGVFGIGEKRGLRKRQRAKRF